MVPPARQIHNTESVKSRIKLVLGGKLFMSSARNQFEKIFSLYGTHALYSNQLIDKSEVVIRRLFRKVFDY